MNIYDFDQTVFYPDSSFCFVLFCLRRYPRCVLPAFPRSIIPAVRYFTKRSDATGMKEKLFSFLRRLPDVDTAVAEFWEKHRDRLQAWYLLQKKEDDLIISASPEFLLKPICRELGVSLIATRMDKHTGRIWGANCHDQEKVRRFRREYPDARPERFYSDSLSDSPMAELAEEAFLVQRDKISPWPLR